MALFIVLWLVNSTKSVKASVSGYFRDPRGYTQKLGAGPGLAGEGITLDHDSVRQLKDRIQQALRQLPDFGALRRSIEFTVTGEGLRIDLMENEQGLFFVSGSPEPSDAGRRLLALLAAEVRRLPNEMVIEGHTDSRPFRKARPASGYGNWELSTDRAHAARRLMIEAGLPEGRIMEVRGFANRRLLSEKDPDSARNRRISIVIRFQGDKEPHSAKT